MTKDELSLIESFIDKKNPKFELNYAYFGDDGVFATDTRRAIWFHAGLLGMDCLLHKKILKGFVTALEKDEDAYIDSNNCLVTTELKMNCDTWNSEKEAKYPDMKSIIDKKLDDKFTLSSIDDIQFELVERDCFIDGYLLEPIIKFSSYDKYYISYTKQDLEKKEPCIIKIVAVDENEEPIYSISIIGRKFESEAK